MALIVWSVTWPASAAAQCGGDRLDGVCDPSCSGDPLAPEFDADCFTCSGLESPAPKRACATEGAACEIHEGILRMGAMIEEGRYDDRRMREVVLAYWQADAWDLPVHWGASALDGYVVYSVVRAALEFEEELDQHPTTQRALACLLRDHADRSIPVTEDNGERWFHGSRSAWNSWSEDYMGFALGYAAADAWLRTTDTGQPYADEYYERVDEAIDTAFRVTEEGGPETLAFGQDPDPDSTQTGPSVMLRNHDEYSPVYAMVILKHVADVNAVYRAAGLPPHVTCASKPMTYDALYRWVVGKTEANTTGGGWVFRADGCQRSDGALSHCDDRSGGHQREPGHYPLARSLPELCVAEGLERFSARCDWYGPAGIRQRPHNYVFNCVFTDAPGADQGGRRDYGELSPW